MNVFKDEDDIAQFFQQAVLAQMQGHPILATEYVGGTIARLIKNAQMLTEAMCKHDLRL